MPSVECSGRGCAVLVPIGDVAPAEAWCSVACAGGIMRQQATTRPRIKSPGLRAPAGVSTAKAPAGATAGTVDTPVDKTGWVGTPDDEPANVEYGGHVWKWWGRYYYRSTPEGTILLHRQVWIDANGPVPDGHHIDHNRRNWKLENLRAIPAGQNLREQRRPPGEWVPPPPGVTGTCKRGHPKAEHWYVAPGGGEHCKACVRENRAARKTRAAC